MYVCMHGAANLQGLDRNGLSDPYCVLYNNGKKVSVISCMRSLTTAVLYVLLEM